jgi:glycosyltransferase involved in cell wall biosynthesis
MHIIVGLKPHGAETMLKRLIEAAPSEFPNTVVVSLTSIEVIGEALRDQGVTVQALNMTSGFSAFLGLWRLTKLIRRYQPDIVQTWMYHADFLGGLAARLAGHNNIVWGVRRTSLSFGDSFQTAFVMKLCVLLSRWIPKRIICNAEAAKGAHISAGYRADRMLVIPNGFDFSRFDTTLVQRTDFRRANGFKESDIVVGAVSRFHPDKGQFNLIQAAAIVARNQPNAKFLLVGRGCDSGNATLVEWLDLHALKDRFVLLGERNDVPACLAGMDVFCMPSRTEGFPNGLGEAMAVGLPCVATAVGDAGLLVGDAAILVPPEDDQALAQGLLSVMAMPNEQREDLGQRARRRVRTDFPIVKARERFNLVYQQLLLEDKP